VFLRSRPDKVFCRFGGEHSVSTGRLHVISARRSDVVRSRQLVRDAEAQHWLGWGEDQEQRLPSSPPNHDPVQLFPHELAFIGLDVHTGLLLASVTLSLCSDGTYEVGGMVDPDFRGRGYGHETLDAVCLMAHQHFGIDRLRAGCEATNIASQRWLASSHFSRTPGPEAHQLPNGRVIEAMWWQRTDPAARRPCRVIRLSV
jgi:RimJ/RimL family protein N-acetyltransferase